MAANFKLLGTGAGPGVPSFFCNCIACREARANPHLSRTRSGALLDTIQQKILIDASPDLRTQLIREKIETVDCLFLTHWHYDHYGGLGDLEYYVRLKRYNPIRLFLPPDSLASFTSAYPYLLDIVDLKPWQFGQKYSFQEVTVTPLPARHSIQTAGMLLEADQRIAYFTDTAGLPEITARQIEKVDYFICDASFYGDNWFPESHLSVGEAINLGREIKAQQIVLTHLSMHYSTPVTVAQLEEEIGDDATVILAYDGISFNLSG